MPMVPGNYSSSSVLFVFKLSDVKDGASQAAPAFGFGSKQAGTFGSSGKRQSGTSFADSEKWDAIGFNIFCLFLFFETFSL